MTRLLCLTLISISSAPFAFAAEPPYDSIDRAILVQKAMADARDLLAANDPAGAAVSLEAQLPHANVNRSYLDLLCKAYHGELSKLRIAKSPDLKRQDTIAKRLAILEGTSYSAPNPITLVSGEIVSPPEALPVLGNDWLKSAGSLFNQAKNDPSRYREAAELFAKAQQNNVAMTPEQRAAWAYCRVKLAADELNKPTATVDIAKSLEADVTAALTLVPGNAGLQKAGKDVLASARSITGGKAISKPSSDANLVEGANVRVQHFGRDDLASAVAKAVETQRKAISEKWFGPAGAPWSPKCEIVIHANAAAFATATGMSEKATGKADVTLENGTVKSRRIDLRADDDMLLTVALPRELTHVVLADLFPNKPPPRWAEEAIAILSAGPAEAERFKRAAPRLAADGQLPSADQIVASTAFPDASRITGFYVASVSIVDYLIEKKGERAFATFLTDAQRYGIEPALRRQYNLTPSQLDAAWHRAALSTARGQSSSGRTQ